MGCSMVMHGGTLYVGAPNAMASGRPAGLVFPFSVLPGDRQFRWMTPFLNPYPTGRPNVPNTAFFTDPDGFGRALASSEELGVFVGAPYWDDTSRNTRHNEGGVFWVVRAPGAEDLVLPNPPMPPGAMFGYSIDARGRVMVAGAPGAQKALVFDWSQGAQPAVTVLRPPWIDGHFGCRVWMSSESIFVYSSRKLYTFARSDLSLSSFGPVDAQDAIHVESFAPGPQFDAYYFDAAPHISIIHPGKGAAGKAPFHTSAPPQFVPLVWIDDAHLAAGDMMANNGAGVVRIFEVTE